MREKTLRELEGPAWADPDHPSPMVRRIGALGGVPIRDFSAEDLRLVIGQGRGARYLVPLALDRLDENPLAEGHFHRGDLLLVVARLDHAFWTQHPELRVRTRAVIERALSVLEAAPPYDAESLGADAADSLDREHLEPRLRDALRDLEAGS